nr:MAG TPA: hypothetical protein [Crassvirales sp.]
MVIKYFCYYRILVYYILYIRFKYSVITVRSRIKIRMIIIKTVPFSYRYSIIVRLYNILTV